jgi:4-hydroxy-3-methylbut-2-enyl diphosphate reductase
MVSPPKEDICYATQNRQEAVRQIAQRVQACLVVGSQNSSNSQRLCELAADSGIPAFLIDGVKDLRRQWFDGIKTVMVTAGASAPETVVQECLDWLRTNYNATIEPVVVRNEDVHFPLPKVLRPLAQLSN